MAPVMEEQGEAPAARVWQSGQHLGSILLNTGLMSYKHNKHTPRGFEGT